MINAFIYIGGKAYEGEDIDKTIPANIGGNGFYNPNQSKINLLKLGDKPKNIMGLRNLKSEINRIFEHMQQGIIPTQSILIKVDK